MTNSKIITGTAALVALVAVGGLAGVSFAYQGDPDVKGPEYSEERHDSMEEAFENKDYNTWRELMDSRGRVTDVITEENFEKFAEIHNLVQEGRLEEAKQLREELGLGQGLKRGGMEKGNCGLRETRGMGNKGSGCGGCPLSSSLE